MPLEFRKFSLLCLPVSPYSVRAMNRFTSPLELIGKRSFAMPALPIQPHTLALATVERLERALAVRVLTLSECRELDSARAVIQTAQHEAHAARASFTRWLALPNPERL